MKDNFKLVQNNGGGFSIKGRGNAILTGNTVNGRPGSVHHYKPRITHFTKRFVRRLKYGI